MGRISAQVNVVVMRLTKGTCLHCEHAAWSRYLQEARREVIVHASMQVFNVRVGCAMPDAYRSAVAYTVLSMAVVGDVSATRCVR